MYVCMYVIIFISYHIKLIIRNILEYIIGQLFTRLSYEHLHVHCILSESKLLVRLKYEDDSEASKDVTILSVLIFLPMITALCPSSLAPFCSLDRLLWFECVHMCVCNCNCSWCVPHTSPEPF